ncbi:MAG: LysE family transporter [Dehalococcoidia bacterium]|jgi:threonine/homoserine/homoserine lactone efflux protein
MFKVFKSSISLAIVGGFFFGMMLQLSIGPICLYIFKTGFARGFIAAETAVLAVALIDTLYIVLAISGLSTLISGEKSKWVLRIIGACVVSIFGINIILTQFFKINLLPTVNLFSDVIFNHPFYDGLLLTASNPLTIIFWSGVFATKISENDFSKKDLIYFSAGCVIATLVFLTLVALAGSLIKDFLPSIIIQWLNLAVGVTLIFFAGKMLLSRKT